MFAKKTKSFAFSLVELLAVIAIILLLMGILMPALSAAKAQGRQFACKSNIRQLLLANIGYSIENDGFYVPAASDLWVTLALGQGGYYRWHGKRDRADEPFDPKKGPLAEYLADGKVKECPERVKFTQDQSWSINFEQGCGGYGYNMQYLGSRLWQSGITTPAAWRDAYAKTTNTVEVRRPDMTLMFCDTAFCKSGQYLVEYSFAEPPYFVVNGKPDTSGKIFGFPLPSIHFRHRSLANIGWADGHIDAREMADFDIVNAYGVKSTNMMLGWFEPIDNSLFDLE